MTNKQTKKTVKSIATKKTSELKTALKSFGYMFPETEEEFDAFENMCGSTEIELPEHLKDLNFLNKKKENQNGKVISIYSSIESSNNITAYAAREGHDVLPDYIKIKMANDKKESVEKMTKAKASKKKK